MQLSLIIVGGNHNGKSIRLKLPAILGRGGGSTLKLPYSLVSRQHCEIFVNQNALRIRDLGSLNGTLVDQKRISETELSSGQLVTIGSITFRVDWKPTPLETEPTSYDTDQIAEAMPTLNVNSQPERKSNKNKLDGGKSSGKRLAQNRGSSKRNSASRSAKSGSRKTAAKHGGAGSKKSPTPDLSVTPNELPPSKPRSADAPIEFVAATDSSGLSISSDSIFLNPDKYLPPAAAPPAVPAVTAPLATPLPNPVGPAPVARLATIVRPATANPIQQASPLTPRMPPMPPPPPENHGNE